MPLLLESGDSAQPRAGGCGPALRARAAGDWFVLTTHDDANIRISVTLIGLPAFARAVLQHVHPSRIDADTHSVLQQTAGGTLPRIWG